MARAGSTMQADRRRTPLALVGGVAAVAAGLCWSVKGLAILVSGDQPPLLFELAPLLMVVTVLALGQHLPGGGARTTCGAMAGVALLLSVVVLVGDVAPLPTVARSIATAGANLLILVCLLTVGWSARRRPGSRLPLVLGLITVPAVLLGGLAAELLGERALELPLVALGVAWVMLGVQLARGRFRLG